MSAILGSKQLARLILTTRYNKILLDDLKERVKEGTENPCIQGGVLKDPEASNLTEEELISISLSMMAVSRLCFSLYLLPGSN